MHMYIQVDALFITWPTTCWKYCIFNIDNMDAKMDIFARNHTLSHMRTNEVWIIKRNCALFIAHICICLYSRKHVWVCMQTEEALIGLHKCLSLQLAYVDSYNVRLLLQWPRQFELLKRRSVNACGACKSCRFYVSLNLLHVYLLVVTFSIYFTRTEWLFKKDRSCSERRQIIIIIIIIIIQWKVCSNKQTGDSCR